jgi:hypothetical protein
LSLLRTKIRKQTKEVGELIRNTRRIEAVLDIGTTGIQDLVIFKDQFSHSRKST